MHRLRENLAIQQDDGLRIDVHAAATTFTVKDGRADSAIGELHRAAGIGRNLNDATARLVGFRRHSAIRHSELVAGVDLDIARVAGAGAATCEFAAIVA